MSPATLVEMVRRFLVPVLLVLLAVGLWFAFGPRRTPVGQAGLTEVRDIEGVRRWFNDSASSVRVVALLSPT